MWLKPGDRENANTAKDRKKVAGSPLPNRIVCRTGKLKSVPTTYSSLTRADEENSE